MQRQSVLVLGATGRVGSRVVNQLLERQFKVIALVRNPEKMKASDNLTTVKGDIFSSQDIQTYSKGVSSIVSCLGHVMSFPGIFTDDLLVKKSAIAVTDAIENTKIKFIHLSTVGIDNPDGSDNRGFVENILLNSLHVLAPLRDNQATVDHLYNCKNVEWTIVRPGSFVDGPVTKYDHVLTPISTGNTVNMDNIAHFMCELVENESVWSEWRHKMPVIKNIVESK